MDPDFNLPKILGDPVVIRDWTINGLPQDQLSIENAIFISNAARWPLMIDPQGQANKWIKFTGRDKNLAVTKLSMPTFLRTLENAIRYGQQILLENVEETIDPALEPVLLKHVFKKGGQLLLHLGDQDIPYSNEFKL